MGIDLTKQLFARHAGNLTASELTVLGYMCITALDAPNKKGQQARLYFGGWEPLALALGYDALTAAAKEKVRRAIKGCREKGLLEPMVAHAKTGSRQSYYIRVGNPTGAPIQSPTWGTDSEPQEGHRFGGKRGTDSEPPRTELGEAEDLDQDSTLIAGEQVQAAGGSKSSGHKFVGQPGNDCGTCGKGYQNRAAHPLHLAWGA